MKQVRRWSLRLKLAALFVLIFGITLVGFSALLYRTFTRTHQSEFDAALYNYAVDVSQVIDIGPFGELRIDTDLLSEEGKVLPFSVGNAFFQVRSGNGQVLARSRILGRTQIPLPPEGLQQLLHAGTVFSSLPSSHLPTHHAVAHSYRVISYLIERAQGFQLILQIAVPMTFLENERSGLITFFIFAIPLVLIVAMFGGLYLSRKALLPVIRIIEKAQSIRPEQLSERVPVPRSDDELKKLAETLNDLLSRLQRAFESQERFVADASHQLKTPLSVLRGELDLVRSRPRSQEEVSEFLTSASQEIDHLSRMVENLLVLARFDSGMAQLAMSDVRLDEMVLECVCRLERIAKEKKVSLRVNLIHSRPQDPDEMEFRTKGDPELLRVMIYNLIENAVKFLSAEGVVEVRLDSSPQFLKVTVRDNGPGIPQHEMARIFERFYRGEGRGAIQGVGLGLPLARHIAQVHGGNLEALSQPGAGSEFVARIKKTD